MIKNTFEIENHTTKRCAIEELFIRIVDPSIDLNKMNNLLFITECFALYFHKICRDILYENLAIQIVNECHSTFFQYYSKKIL